MSAKKATLILPIITVLLAAAGLIYEISTREEPPIFSKTDRFYCTLRADPEHGGDVWTVMYRHDKGEQPWLNMVNSFGDGWNTQKRCDKIAERLEDFRKDGLTEFTYRNDPNTPKQAVICAKTKISGDNCPLLVTLVPGTDPYIALREMIEGLEQGTTVDQSNVAKSLAEFSRDRPVIKLKGLLAEEDLSYHLFRNENDS